MPILIIAIIIIFCGIFSLCTGQVDDWIYENNAFLHNTWDLTVKYFYLFAGAGCLALSWGVFIYFKPHPAQKHFEAYKKNVITRQQAIEKIASTMFNPFRDRLPSARKSKSIERRVRWLRKRVKAEEDFINDLINYMRIKSRMG